MARVSNPQGKSILPDGAVVRGYTVTYRAMGGMSAVYHGRKDDKSYILKEAPASEPAQVLALTQEKGLLERLRHPGIVRFVNLFEEAGFYYMVQELIDGITLEEVKQSRLPSEAEVRDWGLQLCDVLEYLHQQSPPIVYRDLKPANVMLSGDRIRMIDFGIARLHKGDRSEDTEALGSFFTASPEHFGAAETDARSDVFSLGATMHDLLAGPDYRLEMPFQFPPIRKLNPAVSKELEAVLLKATAFEPADRYQSMAEMRAALGGKKAVPAPPAPVATRPPTRGKIAAALVLVVVTIVAALAWTRSGGDSHGHAHDTGLRGNVFGVREEKDSAVVTLGEDIGLFRVQAAFGQKAQERAIALAGRLNRLYHEQCPTCGVFKLEPEGFRIARYVDKKAGLDETVLFYSHRDGDNYRAPLLLAVLSQQEAARLGTTPRYAAGYWRNLTRDLVELSRGRATRGSPLGEQLQQELLTARKNMQKNATIENLNRLLEEIDGQKALQLREMFEKLPKGFKCDVDRFKPTGNFKPLTG
ncbi:serine/threonine protein kinase [bacterium CPR1]|nr:serine/threonine protein kinase [bacterium CPR1]